MRTFVARLEHLLLAVLIPVVVGGCARRLPDADPADIPAIRAQLEATPGDVALQTRLGIALFKSGQHQEAIATLTPVVQAGEASGAAYLYLGMANEELENWAAAREAYSRYIETGRFDPVKDQLRGRLAMIVRRELQAQSRLALAQEAQISQQPPTARSVAVFPFRLVSDNEELEPLQVALADMMITDLGLSGGLTVLERTQIQSLIDEMALTEAGYTEDAQGQRAGRMLRAEHVVQGALTTLGDQAIRFDADVLNTQQGNRAGNMSQEQQLDALFDLEKAVVFQVLDVLGVELTPAEREAIDQNRAASLLAFLAYGRGLQAMDRGDYVAAAGFFDQAIRLDPGFDAARVMAGEASQLADAFGTTTLELADAASIGVMAVSAPPSLPPVGVTPDIAGTLANVDQGVNPTPTAGTIDLGDAPGTGSGSDVQSQNRDPVQESTGTDAVTSTSTAKITIQIRRPGTEN